VTTKEKALSAFLLLVLLNCCITDQKPANQTNVTKYTTSPINPTKSEPAKVTTSSAVKKPTTTATSIRAAATTRRIEVTSTIPGKETSTASVLDIPIPSNTHCFYFRNKDLPECSKFFEGSGFACRQYYNPVCGSDGLFYPSACWAERLGTKVASYSQCESMKRFVRDLWATKRLTGKRYIVPSPDIEFVYSNVNDNWKSGTWIRSQLFKNPSEYVIMDFNVFVAQGANMSTSTIASRTSSVAKAGKQKALMVYILFDDVFPEHVLLDWTKKYEKPLNDYLRQKQHLREPTQLDITPVVISPPEGVGRPKNLEQFLDPQQTDKVYQAAIRKAGSANYAAIIISPIALGMQIRHPGYHTTWKNTTLILTLSDEYVSYSETDRIRGLAALSSFHSVFGKLQHEMLHAFGLPGDHGLLDSGYFLDYFNQNVDKTTGMKGQSKTSKCDFIAVSPDYYPMELPDNLKTTVGKEPAELAKQQSPSGNCLEGFYTGELLKDFDLDGEYEIMYKNELVAPPLQRSLGWMDVDGDNIAELDDKDPYGGFKEISAPTSEGSTPLSGFEPLGEVNIGDCVFEKIRLTSGQEGLAPLKCAEFDSDAVNLYKQVRYYWVPIKKPYGTVLLARLG